MQILVLARRSLGGATLLFAVPVARLVAQSPADTATTLKFGAFVDGYYAYDFNRPRTLDRAFTTQPARHNEFNVNLAYVEGVVSAPRVRGRLALQFGTSVQANYGAEPRVGTYSGPDLTRFVQEATAGVRLSTNLWLDGGIYLSHVGSEAWISRDNLTYTRSLMADFSPYYQSGVKLTWQATPTLSAQLHVLNGWQNISETNNDKALGARIDWTPSGRVTLSAYNFIGNEAPDSSPSQMRIFQGGSVKLAPNDRVTVQGTFDYGRQRHPNDAGASGWYGTSVIARVQSTPRSAIVARVERYADPDQIIVVTGSANAFKTNGASLGIDLTPAPGVLWRSEVRALSGANSIFPTHSGALKHNTMLVTSLALTFH